MAKKPTRTDASAILAAKRPDRGPTSLEWQALAIAAKEAAKHRGDVQVGKDQLVDITLRISGHVDVADDSMSMIREKPTAEKPTAEQMILTMLVATPEEERNALANRLAKLHPKVLAQADEEKLPAGVSEIAGNLLAVLSKQKQQARRGSTTGALLVDLVARDGKAPKRRAA